MYIWHAERDVSGLCCPLELRSILADSFKQTDEDLLRYLRGKPCLKSPGDCTQMIGMVVSWSTLACTFPRGIYVCTAAGHEDEEERTSGATATVVLARTDKLVVANVGDSRAVLSRR